MGRDTEVTGAGFVICSRVGIRSGLAWSPYSLQWGMGLALPVVRQPVWVITQLQGHPSVAPLFPTRTPSLAFLVNLASLPQN